MSQQLRWQGGIVIKIFWSIELLFLSGLVQPIEVSEGVLKIPPTVNENLVELSTADWTSGSIFSFML